MRCLLISDIHANIAALDCVLKDADGHYDVVWCLGDIVGYGPDPNECVERLRGLPLTSLVGNHDWAVLGKLDPESFNADARTALRYSATHLTPANRDFLETLVPYTFMPPFTLVHGSPRHPVWEYILDSTIADANFELFPGPTCLVGHTHSAVLFRRSAQGAPSVAELPRYGVPIPLPPPGGDRLIINPGSVGQPRDSDSRSAYALLDLDASTYEARRVEYPIEQTQERMRRAKLPHRLIARLEYGW